MQTKSNTASHIIYDKIIAYDLSMIINGCSPFFLYPFYDKEKMTKDIISHLEQTLHSKRDCNILFVTRKIPLDGVVCIFKKLKKIYSKNKNILFYDFFKKYTEKHSRMKMKYLPEIMKDVNKLVEITKNEKTNIILLPEEVFLFSDENLNNMENSEIYSDSNIYYSKVLASIEVFHPFCTDIDILKEYFEGFDIINQHIENSNKNNEYESFMPVNIPRILENPHFFNLYGYIDDSVKKGSGFRLVPKNEISHLIKNPDMKILYELSKNDKFNIFIPYFNDENYMDILVKECLLFKRKDIARKIYMKSRGRIPIKLKITFYPANIPKYMRKFKSLNILMNFPNPSFQQSENSYHRYREKLNILYHAREIAQMYSPLCANSEKCYNIFLSSFNDNGFYYIDPTIDDLVTKILGKP